MKLKMPMLRRDTLTVLLGVAALCAAVFLPLIAAAYDSGVGGITWPGQSRVTSTLNITTTTTAMANITGLSATLTGGNTYYFDLALYGTTSGNVAGGNPAYDLNGGTATATSISGQGTEFTGIGSIANGNAAPISALNTPVCNYSILAFSKNYCRITGTITVNTGGTFIPRWAQTKGSGGTTSLLAGSFMIVNQIQ